MPRIDPQQLLVCLTPLLAQNGGIKSPGEVIRLANLMEKYSKKLVSKCIYIQILKCTETDLLGQFMAAGGWNLVHNWLRDGGDSNNWAFIQELLEMLLLCPVDGNRLKSNHTPKIVKNLSLSCPHNTVRILSSKLVEQWLKIAHQEKQQLTASQTNGLQNGLNGNAASIVTDVSKSVNDNKVGEALQPTENNNVQVSEDDATKKQAKENVKYKVSNKEGSGKLLLSLKRSTSPSVDEKDSNLSRSSSLESKSKSSSDKDKERQKKSSSSSHKSSSSSSKSSHRDKTRSSSTSSHHKSSSRDKTKDSSRSSSSKHSSSSSSSRDKDKRKKDTEKSQAEKDKETLNLLAPLSSSKLQRIPKRQHSDNSENKSSELNKDPTDVSPSKVIKTAEPVEKKKPSISIEVRKGDKPKTVKTINSQFRNHGLAEEPPKPPSRRDLKKPATAAPLILLPTLPSAASLVKTSTPTTSSPPPSKKIHLDKVLDLENVPERVGGIKLIKPKPMLVESIGFMDALSASTVAIKKDPKKRKRLPSNSKKDEPESPKIDVKPLKFYKDTFEEAEEPANGEKSPKKELETSTDEQEVKTEKQDDGDKSPKSLDVSEKSTTGESKEEIAEIDEPEEKRGPGIGCGPDGPPGVLVHPNIPRRKKRPIRWRSDEELTEIRFFELDETERTNVSKTFTEQKQMEHVEERSAFKLGRKAQSDDTMAEQTKWRALIIVDNVPEINYGYKSREAEIQAEREKNVLQELYFRHSINDSPHEPDPESYEHEEPQIVPQEDVTGNRDSINVFTDIQWPAPKGDLSSTFSTNAFGNVFTHINIPSALGIPPSAVLNSSIANPLASFHLGGIPGPMARDIQNPIINQWMIPPAPYLQPPPIPQSTPGFPVRGGSNNMNNNYRSNNSRPHGNNNNNGGSGGGNWVRGNARQGICNQFRRTGNCRNKNCPYVHER